MTLTEWLSLLSICLLGAMSPGPSLAVVMGNTLGGGKGAGLVAALAHGAGVALYGLLTVAGLAVVITGSPVLFKAIQVLGALYILYLGINSLRSSGSSSLAASSSRAGSAARDGFLVAFLNPKLAVFMLALFSQFLRPEAGIEERTVMVATVGVTDASWYAAVVLLISRPAFLERLRNSAATIDRLFGIVLIVVALSVLASIAMELTAG